MNVRLLAFAIPRKLKIAAMTGALLLASVPVVQSATMSREYQTGYYAYKSGDFKEARQSWEVAALKDDPYAQYALGLMNYRGDIGHPDYVEAAKWFQKAANANHSGAIYYIGLLYFNGHGLHYDQFRATQYFKRALEADPKNGDAAYLIGAQYFHGRGARQNFVEAARYFELAANTNHHAAQFMFGAMLERGWGREENREEAYYWLRRATLGPITLPPGVEMEIPMDPIGATATLEARLRSDQITRVDKRLHAEGFIPN
ncbi:tetratricopeptide repeat protein [Thalassospira aquimaris]|uniref:Tetratricopeptide repeat protein n=1 Tax=Thalassospira aquimaris TaxID=3037796 RepID=A0ABT6GGK1_9PROT|nr:tetratricopeptide repeat protein [Thalassospira sp. FZY0004]MDG4721208.1 tetratricopeptide repeat protein [Thalassospira sp. FZY0004]